jgi:hypothetical protein
MVLAQDPTGFQMEPHTDAANRWVSMMMYLPAESLQSEEVAQAAGTVLLNSTSGKEKRGVAGDGELPWKDGDFVPTNTVPFASNTLLAFAPCVTSWHAVMQYAGESTRDSIQVMPPIPFVRYSAHGQSYLHKFVHFCRMLPLIASDPGVRLGHEERMTKTLTPPTRFSR